MNVIHGVLFFPARDLSSQDRNLSPSLYGRGNRPFGAYARHGLWETLGESEQRRARLRTSNRSGQLPFDRPVTELSGGERQRVLLARSLFAGGETYLLDEPTAELDPVEEERVMHTFQGLSRKGACVVMALHDPVPCRTLWKSIGPAWKNGSHRSRRLPRSLLRAYFQGPMRSPSGRTQRRVHYYRR